MKVDNQETAEKQPLNQQKKGAKKKKDEQKTTFAQRPFWEKFILRLYLMVEIGLQSALLFILVNSRGTTWVEEEDSNNRRMNRLIWLCLSLGILLNLITLFKIKEPRCTEGHYKFLALIRPMINLLLMLIVFFIIYFKNWETLYVTGYNMAFGLCFMYVHNLFRESWHVKFWEWTDQHLAMTMCGDGEAGDGEGHLNLCGLYKKKLKFANFIPKSYV